MCAPLNSTLRHTVASSARNDAWATIKTLRSNLLTDRSATRTLEAWCELHGFADPPIVHALVQSDMPMRGAAAHYPQLRVRDSDTIRLRCVLLTCGTRILSEARNCYVPSRLTANMNKLLETTDLPFGKVVADLDFERRTLSSNAFWRPEAGRAPPEHLFENRAILTLDAGRLPIAALIETYRRDVLPIS